LTLLAPNWRISSLDTTLIDCGVSLISRSRLVAPVLARLARCATTRTASSSVAAGSPISPASTDAAGAASTTAIATHAARVRRRGAGIGTGNDGLQRGLT